MHYFTSKTSKYAALAIFLGVVITIWISPILLAGRMYDIPLMLDVRNVAFGCSSVQDNLGRILSLDLACSLGQPTPFDGRISVAIFALIAQVVSLQNLIGWSVVSCLFVSLALLGWWFDIEILFDERTAWVSTAILAFMPFFWREAVWLDYYSVSYVFLAWSAAVFLLVRSRSEKLAFALAGILFGFSIAAKDVFLIFLPWIVCFIAWNSRYHWKNALGKIGIFLLCAGGVYLLQYVGDIVEFGYPINYNLARFWPGAEHLKESFYLHLYPDSYTYLFARDAFDANFLARYESLSLLEKLREHKAIISFGLGDPSIGLSVLNGVWLFVGSLPSLFQMDTVGGFALWIFIIPGISLLWHKRRSLLISLIGFALSGELIIRFVMHYGRDHLMDYGWILALFAGLGICNIAERLSRANTRLSSQVISLVITLILVLHLLQVNRVVFARRYSRTSVPQIIQMASALDALPNGSVVAAGIGATRVEQVAQISNRTIVLFAESTMQNLLYSGEILDVLNMYGVTHLLGYDDSVSNEIISVKPSVQNIAILTQKTSPTVTTAQGFLLHLLR